MLNNSRTRKLHKDFLQLCEQRNMCPEIALVLLLPRLLKTGRFLVATHYKLKGRPDSDYPVCSYCGTTQYHLSDAISPNEDVICWPCAINLGRKNSPIASHVHIHANIQEFFA